MGENDIVSAEPAYGRTQKNNKNTKGNKGPRIEIGTLKLDPTWELSQNKRRF